MTTLQAPGVTAGVLQRLSRLRPDSRALWGKMNAGQMVCHLNDSFLLGLGQRRFSEDITFLNRTLVRWVALHMPLTWPKGVPTRPEADALVGGTPPADFAGDVAALHSSITRFAAKPGQFRPGRHPIFGELTEWEWMRWGYLHSDHHFRQFGI